MSALIDSNPEYRDVIVMRVDWDEYRGSELVSSLGIRRRSTMVMFKQGQEVARTVAQTSRASIDALFQAAM